MLKFPSLSLYLPIYLEYFRTGDVQGRNGCGEIAPMPHCPPEYSNCKVLQIVFITGIDKSTRKKRRKTYATFIRFVCFMSCKSELNELKFQAHGGNKPYEKYVDIKIKKNRKDSHWYRRRLQLAESPRACSKSATESSQGSLPKQQEQLNGA